MFLDKDLVSYLINVNKVRERDICVPLNCYQKTTRTIIIIILLIIIIIIVIIIMMMKIESLIT